MGGLADIEFLVQGNQLVGGFKSFHLQKRSVRDALRGLVSEKAISMSSSEEMRAAFELLRSLEHRMRLLTNSSSSRITPKQFELLREVKLWPRGYRGASVESWQELVQLRRRIRSAMRAFCPDLAA
jgi:glutamate-ammonia-ligase adenylyltransferase